MSALPFSSSSLIRRRQRELLYDIFLSFNGKDTRKSFTDHLLSALTRKGIKTFRDDKSLERGEEFAPELLRAIRESRGSIIVISKGYAFSPWCLDELIEIMKQRKERGHRVYPIFYYVEPSDFRRQINSVEEAFDQHKKRYEKETTQGWQVALKEVTAINGWPLKDQYESVFIEDIVSDVSKKFDAEVLDEQEVEWMKNTFQITRALLVDAENKLYTKGGEAVKVWLDELKHIAYDMDDVLDEWHTAILKSKIEKDQGQTHSTSSSPQSMVCNIPLRIKELKGKYQAIVKKKDDFPFALDPNYSCTDLTLERPKTISLIDESDVYGRDREKDVLVSLLLGGGNGKGIPLLAIVGMGGIGKTTLAQLVYNNEEVKRHFHHRIWVCVSDPFNEVSIAKAVLRAFKGTSSSFDDLESLLWEIHQKIAGKKFLLVLDDVWNEDEQKWQYLKSCLQSGSQESKILVTTRKENVATIMGCTDFFRLGKLSQQECWSLFSQIAFSGRNDRERESLEDIGKKIAYKCQGLPLAAKTLGGLLRFKKSREQWQRILDSHMWELDEVEKGIFSPLLLSYYDLPWQLRQCFSYCAIFPKDHIIEKDLLIKLWMAQGFLGETQGNEMEIIGEEYFDNLATRSFFQEFEKDADDDSIIVRCKMHDIVHDFAQLLRKTECCELATNGIEEQRAEFYHEHVRHLTFILDNKDVAILDATYNVKKLRSLLLVESWYYDTSSLEASLPKLFDQLTCLRMLNLSNNLWPQYSMIELPKEIGKLIHLRYLSLEGNENLYELPEALCDLCNLQTLNIRWCDNLQTLPLGMGKLINLRHLQNAVGSCRFIMPRAVLMPRGMQKLTCLRTLEECSVRKERDGIESEISFSLTGLGKLTHLRGKLGIYGLGDVGEASEAREAQLSTKAGLRELTLCFDGGYYNENDEGSVLEALQPPQHLQFLKIEYCKGAAFPGWMTSLTSLRSVSLFVCCNWKSLPPMGKLPCLESLNISNLWKVKKVGEEFVGVETSSSSSPSFVNHNILAFPNLKTLEFAGMIEWEEWEYEKALRSRGGDDSSSSSSSSSSSNITIMPKLQRLVIRDCLLLKMLPRHLLQSRALQELLIGYSPILYRRFNKETGKDWPSISHIPTVRIWSSNEEEDHSNTLGQRGITKMLEIITKQHSLIFHSAFSQTLYAKPW